MIGNVTSSGAGPGRDRSPHVGVGDIERRISGHQRCGVAVRSETEMNEIEHRRGARQSRRCCGVLREPPPEIGCFDRHRVDVIGGSGA